MGLIKEPLNVDYFVDSKPVTKKELQKISEYINSDKIKRKISAATKQRIRKKSTSGRISSKSVK